MVGSNGRMIRGISIRSYLKVRVLNDYEKYLMSNNDNDKTGLKQFNFPMKKIKNEVETEADFFLRVFHLKNLC